MLKLLRYFLLKIDCYLWKDVTVLIILSYKYNKNYSNCALESVVMEECMKLIHSVTKGKLLNMFESVKNMTKETRGCKMTLTTKLFVIKDDSLIVIWSGKINTHTCLFHIRPHHRWSKSRQWVPQPPMRNNWTERKLFAVHVNF